MGEPPQPDDQETSHELPESALKATYDFGDAGELTKHSHQARERSADDGDRPEIAGHFGRYQIDGLIGEGTFGIVYLARDDELERLVAVKVPKSKQVSPAELEAYLREARTIARLEHPGIVPVYDVGRTDDGVPYVVSKLVDGEDLNTRLERAGLSIREAAELIATLAETLDFVHQQGVVHRDIKPGNVLMDQHGTAFLTDFGLALRDTEFGKGSTWAGTPLYMSPEQARGESHLVDGRSDVFSLGVLLYELLTGSRPFQAETVADLVDRVIRSEPASLRQMNRSVPKELERICLKALAKRSSDRHATAGELADDIRSFLTEFVALSESSQVAPLPGGPVGGDSSTAMVGVVPRGLRSYEEDDAHFFHAMLPGPRDRNGLPDSIAFWKNRIEETDLDRSFRVGLVYGPSGCGKSSFMKAGLLPVLADNVHTLFLEAAPGQTEVRLLNALKRQCPLLPADIELPQAFSLLRRGHALTAGRKMVVVIDQFEQWLHSETDPAHAPLAAALRQCDGRHVQCILLVRADFWLAVSRFMDDLEIELVQNRNMALVDLFDRMHARRVLAQLGKGYGRLPVHLDRFAEPQERFLNEAIDGLARDDRIIPVRLALFAEMVKSRDWTPATLKRLGGIEGVGVTFLEETFGGPTAPVEHRTHRDAVRETLHALLPEAGTDIKGHMRSYEDLLEASGYGSRSPEFDALLSILDGKLRLITPTDVERDDASEPAAEIDPTRRYFQLTHDYLVPAIREWTMLRQKQSARGRAELALSQRAESWGRQSVARNLPSFSEWVRGLTLTRRRLWTETERDMMDVASRRYSLSSFVLLVLLAVVLAGAWWLRGESRSAALIGQLTTADDSELPAIIDGLRHNRMWSKNHLVGLHDEGDSRSQLLAAVALLKWEPQRVDFIVGELLQERVSPLTIRAIVPYLQPFAERARPACRLRLETADDDPESDGQRFRAALLLSGIDPATATRRPTLKQHAQFIADRLIQESADNRQFHSALVDLIRPARSAVAPILHGILVDDNERELRRNSAAGLLRDMLADVPVELASVFFDTRIQDVEKVLPTLDDSREQIATLLGRVAAESCPPNAANDERDTAARRRATAAAILARHGRSDHLGKLLKLSDDPAPRTYLIHRLQPLGVPAPILVKQLQREADVTIRAALIQVLGQYPHGKLDAELAESAVQQFRRAFLDRRHPELHSSAEWALAQWGQREWTADEYAKMPAETGATESKRWYVNSAGHVMVRVVPDQPGLAPFEVAVQETTVQQYLQFKPDHVYETERCPTPDCPIGGVTWYAAADYCRWLTRREKLDEDDMAFQPAASDPSDEEADVRLVGDYEKRRGYRMLTLEEWQWLVHCGASSPYYLGWNLKLTKHYDAVAENSQGRTWPAATFKPNHVGIFGLYANMGEWCADGPDDSRVIFTNSYKASIKDLDSITEENRSTPTLYWYSMGFRVARSIPKQRSAD